MLIFDPLLWLLERKEDIMNMLLVDGFAARLRSRGLADGTRARYRATAADYVEWLGKPPAEARRADVERYLDRWGGSNRPRPDRRAPAVLRLPRLARPAGRRRRPGAPFPVDRVERPRTRRRPNDSLRARKFPAGGQRDPPGARRRRAAHVSGLRIGRPARSGGRTWTVPAAPSASAGRRPTAGSAPRGSRRRWTRSWPPGGGTSRSATSTADRAGARRPPPAEARLAWSEVG
jgi:hypothetical protein